jgi:hypothetical protein
MEVWERLREVENRLNSYDNSKFVKEFDPERLKFILNKDAEVAKVLAIVEDYVAQLEAIIDKFIVLEAESKHGEVLVSWTDSTLTEVKL